MAVNALVPLPCKIPVKVVAPDPPCATVTAAALVRMVAEEYGSVNVLSDVAGPVKSIKALFVPPFAPGSTPVTPVVNGKAVKFVATPLEGVPRAGVTSVGDVAKTSAPVPVSFVTAEIRFALDGVARKVATPVPRPLTPVAIGRPVALVSVAADGVPRFGVVSVGEVPKTSAPVPVSSDTAAIRFALDGVPKNVATPVPKPLTPVEIGSPVPFVRTTAEGVPNAGVVSVGDVAKTTLPLPVVVAAEIAVPLPDKIPVTDVVSVIAGVEVAVATVPANPFAVTTETLETVPDPAAK